MDTQALLENDVQAAIAWQVQEVEDYGHLQTKVLDVVSAMHRQVNQLAIMIEKMSKELWRYKQSTVGTSRGAATNDVAPRIEYSKPKNYDDQRDANNIENFLWQMKVYFKGMNLVEEAMKVRTATMYLFDITSFWWRRKYV